MDCCVERHVLWMRGGDDLVFRTVVAVVKFIIALIVLLFTGDAETRSSAGAVRSMGSSLAINHIGANSALRSCSLQLAPARSLAPGSMPPRLRSVDPSRPTPAVARLP